MLKGILPLILIYTLEMVFFITVVKNMASRLITLKKEYKIMNKNLKFRKRNEMLKNNSQMRDLSGSGVSNLNFWLSIISFS
jgi:hypothetical protein